MIGDGFTVPEIAKALKVRTGDVRQFLIKHWWPLLVG
jgi:hypothetical protein